MRRETLLERVSPLPQQGSSVNRISVDCSTGYGEAAGGWMIFRTPLLPPRPPDREQKLRKISKLNAFDSAGTVPANTAPYQHREFQLFLSFPEVSHEMPKMQSQDVCREIL
jgi:hypothetical protein